MSLRYKDATFVLAHSLEDGECVSALAWPAANTLVTCPDGILLRLLVTPQDEEDEEEAFPTQLILSRLRFEIYRRFEHTDNAALKREMDGRVTPGKYVTLSSELWLRHVALGAQKLPTKTRTMTVSVQHHLAYFALVRALLRPPPQGFKCINGTSYMIVLDESFERATKTETDAAMLERAFRRQQWSDLLSPEHVFVPHVPKPSAKHWFVTTAPEGPNPLETGATTIALPDKTECYVKHDGRFVLSLTTTKQERVQLQLAKPKDEGDLLVMVDHIGTVLPASEAVVFEMIQREQVIVQRAKAAREEANQREKRKRDHDEEMQKWVKRPRLGPKPLERAADYGIVVSVAATKKAGTLDMFVRKK